MRYRFTYLITMGLVLGACATTALSDTTGTTSAVADMTTTSSNNDSPGTSNGAVEIRTTTDWYDILDPGEYWIDHDADPATSLRVDFTIADPGWGPLIGTNKQAGERYAQNYVAVKFFAIDRVATAACDGTEFLPAGETAEALAKQLASIKDFETLEPLAKVTALGYDGYHVVLAVPQDGFVGDRITGCDDALFDSWQGPSFAEGRYYQGPGQAVEFWVLDVEGSLLSIEATWFPDSPAEDLAQLRSIIDSVTITP